jgi:peptidylprolyl isomerase
MAQVKQGDRVRINFTGTLRDGSVFDTTYGDKCADEGCCEEIGPMEMTIGEEDFFPEVEKALIGMTPGGRKTVFIPAADAFGEYDEENVFSVDRDQIPGDFVPEAGQELELTDEEGDALPVTVVEVTDDSITFDANHPLAGEDITYEIELVSIL